MTIKIFLGPLVCVAVSSKAVVLLLVVYCCPQCVCVCVCVCACAFACVYVCVDLVFLLSRDS